MTYDGSSAATGGQAAARELEKLATKIEKRARGNRLDEPATPEPGDVEGLIALGEAVAAATRPSLRRSLSAELVYGVHDRDETTPGQHVVRLHSKRGEISCLAPPLPSEPLGSRLSLSEACALVSDTDASPENRIAALHQFFALGGQPHELALSSLLRELESGPVGSWRDGLVSIFATCPIAVGERARAAKALLAFVHGARRDSNVLDITVWTALRRGASLLEADCALELAPFLVHMEGIDLRAVALHGISITLELGPPKAPIPDLADRAWDYARKFLDADVFGAGEHSLIGRNAVLAIAALGDARLSGAIGLARGLRRGWLDRRIKSSLQDLRASWGSNGVPTDVPAHAQLIAALAENVDPSKVVQGQDLGGLFGIDLA